MYGADRIHEISEKKVVGSTTRVLRGTPVYNIKGNFDLDKMNFPFAIRGCLCVTEPCPCKDFILWLNKPPLAAKATGKKDAGAEIIEFTVPRDVVVHVEMQVPVKLLDLERVAVKARKAKAAGVRRVSASGVDRSVEPGAAPPTSAQAKGAFDKGWLGLAAQALDMPLAESWTICLARTRAATTTFPMTCPTGSQTTCPRRTGSKISSRTRLWVRIRSPRVGRHCFRVSDGRTVVGDPVERGSWPLQALSVPRCLGALVSRLVSRGSSARADRPSPFRPRNLRLRFVRRSPGNYDGPQTVPPGVLHSGVTHSDRLG